MARYGLWRPLASNWASQPKIVKYDLLILHTMAGSLAGTESWFKRDGYGGAESHFGLGADAACWQWQDTERQANANMAADKRAISVETADYGPGFTKWNLSDGNAIPAWTPAQMDGLVDLVVWASRTHGIPAVLVQDSLPTRRGVAYHRLGVPGYIKPGGEAWSTARGKACPGNRRIAQIPTIVGRAAAILHGGSVKPAPVKPAPPAPGYPSLSEGITDNALLERLQGWANRMYPSYARLIVDGDYGPQTRTFVKEFQRRTGITGSDADGTVIGPRTWAKFAQAGFR